MNSLINQQGGYFELWILDFEISVLSYMVMLVLVKIFNKENN